MDRTTMTMTMNHPDHRQWLSYQHTHRDPRQRLNRHHYHRNHREYRRQRPTNHYQPTPNVVPPQWGQPRPPYLHNHRSK